MDGAITTTIIHLQADREHDALCGDVKVQTAPDPADVTCPRCRSRIGYNEAFVPTTVQHARPAAHTLTAFEHRLASTPPADPVEQEARWVSLPKMAEHVVRVLDDGAPIRSSFRAEAPVQSGYAGDRGLAGRESVLRFTQALDAAFTSPRVFGAVVLSPERCRLILEWRLCGRPERATWDREVVKEHAVDRVADLDARATVMGIAAERVHPTIAAAALSRALGRPLTWRDVRLVTESKRELVFAASATITGLRRGATLREIVTAATLAKELSDEMGVEVTAHQIGVVYRDGMRSMRATLEHAKELRPARRQVIEGIDREVDMAIGEWDLEEWADIAVHVGRSIRTCQEYAARDDDPLPVKIMLGRAVAKKAEVDLWLTRQARARGAA